MNRHLNKKYLEQSKQIQEYLNNNTVEKFIDIKNKFKGSVAYYQILDKHNIVYKDGNSYKWNNKIPVTDHLINTVVVPQMRDKFKGKNTDYKSITPKVRTIVKRENKIITNTKKLNLFWGLIKIEY